MPNNTNIKHASLLLSRIFKVLFVSSLIITILMLIPTILSFLSKSFVYTLGSVGIFDSNNYQLVVLLAKTVYKFSSNAQLGMGICILLYVLCCGIISTVFLLLNKIFTRLNESNSVFTAINTKSIKIIIWLVIALEVNFNVISGIIISLVLWALMQIVNYAYQLQEEVDTTF